MGLNKANLRSELLKIIEKIGENQGDCFVFDINKLSTLWNAMHKGQFKQYGHGKMGDFLRREVGVQESDGKHWIKITVSDASHETEKGAGAKFVSLDTDSKLNSTASPNDSARPKSEEELHGLKVEVLTSIQDYLENSTNPIQRKSYLTLNQLNSAWAQQHPNEKFKMRGFGSFKSFLADKLQFQRPKHQEADCFKITVSGVKRMLQRLEEGESNRGSASTQPGNDTKIQDGKESLAKRDEFERATIINTTCNDSNTVKVLHSSDEPNRACIHPELKSQTDSASKSMITDASVANKGFSEEE